MHSTNTQTATFGNNPAPAPVAQPQSTAAQPQPCKPAAQWVTVPRTQYAGRKPWALPKRAGTKGYAKQCALVQSAQGYSAAQHGNLYPAKPKNGRKGYPANATAKGRYTGALATAYGVCLALGNGYAVQVALATKGKNNLPNYATGRVRVVKVG